MLGESSRGVAVMVERLADNNESGMKRAPGLPSFQ
jgi:hypothetical protein